MNARYRLRTDWRRMNCSKDRVGGSFLRDLEGGTFAFDGDWFGLGLDVG